MAKYKTAEEIQVEQSVGGPNHLDGNPEVSTVLQVFQPDRGRDLLYQNPKFPFTVYPQTHPQEGETHPLAGQSGSTEVYVSYDDRQDLGTITLNDRLTWETDYNKRYIRWSCNLNYRVKCTWGKFKCKRNILLVN